MSRYLYNAAYYWELVVDKRSPEGGIPVYLEERTTGKRHLLKTVAQPRELEDFCRGVQKNLYLSEEEFEAAYGIRLTPHTSPNDPPPSA